MTTSSLSSPTRTKLPSLSTVTSSSSSMITSIVQRQQQQQQRRRRKARDKDYDRIVVVADDMEHHNHNNSSSNDDDDPLHHQPVTEVKNGNKFFNKFTKKYSSLHQSDDNSNDIFVEEEDGTIIIMVDDPNNKRSPKSSSTPTFLQGASTDGNSTVVTNSSVPRKKTTDKKNSHLRQTIVGVIGNVLEWYDFAVFGYLSDILGKVFFPPSNDDTNHKATMESFIVFGSAFLMRPIGGIVLGYIGDTYGRKMALVISIFCMAIPTFVMGCLPSYQTVGNWSFVFLIIIRLLQGLSVGGQLMSSLVFTLENHPQSHWGLYGSFVMASANIGTLLGGLVGYILRRSLSPDQLLSWGWRIPFLAGILVSFSGFYLHSHNDDEEEDYDDDNNGTTTTYSNQRGHFATVPRTIPSPPNICNNTLDGTASKVVQYSPNHPEEFDDDIDVDNADDDDDDDSNHVEIITTRSNPLCRALHPDNLRSLLAATMVPVLWSSGFYLSFVWMAIFMADFIDHPVPGSFGVNAGALFTSVCVFFPVAGMLSDKYGRSLIMKIGGVGIGILGPWLIVVIGKGKPMNAFLAQCVFGVCLSFWGGPMCAWLVESFEPEARLTSVSIGYNVAHAIVGGSTPALATWLVDNVSPTAPGYMYPVVASISLIGLVCVGPAASPVPAKSAKKRRLTSPTVRSQESEIELSSPRISGDNDYNNDDDELL